MSIDRLKEKESSMKKTVSTGSNSTTGIRGSKVSRGSSCDTSTPQKGQEELKQKKGGSI